MQGGGGYFQMESCVSLGFYLDAAKPVEHLWKDHKFGKPVDTCKSNKSLENL